MRYRVFYHNIKTLAYYVVADEDVLSQRDKIRQPGVEPLVMAPSPRDHPEGMEFLMVEKEWHPFRMLNFERQGQGTLSLADECDAVGIKRVAKDYDSLIKRGVALAYECDAVGI